MFLKITHLPLIEIEKDLLNFDVKAKEISDFIVRFPSDVPCSIAINGVWGSGKSTMLNFIESNLSSAKCNVIRFNPWALSDKDEILNSLFEEIYYCIDGGFTNTRNKFFDYAQKLSKPLVKVATYLGQITNGIPHLTANVTADSASEVAGQITKMFFDKPISKIKKELEEELKIMFVENKRKIVILIDEMDRLLPDETIKVFQVIKSILDFPGLFFVVAMDSDTINDSLTKIGINKPEDYLQKIFQHRFQLNSKYQLRTLSHKLLLPAVKEMKFYDVIHSMVAVFIDCNPDKFLQIEYTDNVNGQNSEKRKRELVQSYYSIFRSLRKEFENPRKFIKLVNFIYEKWDAYYLELVEEIKDQSNKIELIFLMFIASFDYYDFIEPNFMSTEHKENYLLELIRNHIIKIFPEVREEIGSNQYKVIDTYQELMKIVINKLLRFPDLLQN